MPVSTADPAPARAAIDTIRGTLQVARALVDSGRRIDLEGLESGAAAVCAAVAMLPPEDARPLRPALEALLREVNDLTAALGPPA